MLTTFNSSDVESEEDQDTGVHNAAYHSDWVKPGYKFPCTLIKPDLEVSLFAEFFALTPKDRWFKIPKGWICYTCLKPKAFKEVCKTWRCSEEKGVPQALLCTACTPWTAAKGWAPFSIIMCLKAEHRQD